LRRKITGSRSENFESQIEKRRAYFCCLSENIDIHKLSYYNPYHYNPNNIKNIYVYNLNNRITYEQLNSNEWNKLIMIISNTFSNLALDMFPLNNPNFKIIQDYSKQYKYKDITKLLDY
jgi:hypothetical protein